MNAVRELVAWALFAAALIIMPRDMSQRVIDAMDCGLEQERLRLEMTAQGLISHDWLRRR